MKIIHTSDWHLGQNFFGYDRTKDHESMIVQLIDLVKTEEPDALIIAGDIFDVAIPNTTVQKSFAEAIVRIHDAYPSMTIVCISGNHDSAARHEVHQTPWEALKVKMIGKANMTEVQENIIPIDGKGWVVAIPYTNERFLNDEFYSRLEAAVKEKTAEELPIVYVGHAAINGCDHTGHDIMNDRFVGGIEYTALDELGSVYDYIALGHIHKAQTFGNGRARYCGTPIPVSFDEVRSGYEHGFSIVEIEAHGSIPSIRTVDVKCPRPLVSIPAEGHAPWEDVIAELKKFPADINAYIRLNVLLKDSEQMPFNKDRQIQEALAGKAALYAVTNPTRESLVSEERRQSAMKAITVEELQKLDPVTVLKSYAESQGQIFSEKFQEMFNTVYRNINNSDHEN
ncbi:MAG: exonuclease SbcCD subunit D [Bacteroidales bacterium]|nr:exonuclease SbcCD subunit D [Bacteroidales bacterium]